MKRQKNHRVLWSSSAGWAEVPNYRKKIEAMIEGGPVQVEPGKVYDAEVRHDEHCAVRGRRGPCDCDPDIVLREVP